MQRFRAQLQTKSPHDKQITQKQAQTEHNHEPEITPKDHTEREVERYADAEERSPKRSSHEVHLGEGANTGAQLPAREDPKTQCVLDAGELSERGGGLKKVSRGASRRRCKHECTTSSQRRPKNSGVLDAGELSERRRSQKGLTRCNSAKVQTRVHNF